MIAASPPFVAGGTKAVLGEGPIGASIALVGEQPGDQEDLQGRPFVGPAGQILNRAMAEAGLDRRSAYVTAAVKHFKFEQRGKRRIHQKPTAGEVKRYRWWLTQELELVYPKIVVALAQPRSSRSPARRRRSRASRGPARFGDQAGYITVHPSYLLRLPDQELRQREYAAFVADSEARQIHG